MLGNMSEDVRRTGEWDRMVRELEAAALEDDADINDMIRQSAIAFFRAYRSELSAADVEALKSRFVGLEDRDTAAGIHDIEGAMAFTAGRYDDAVRSWIANADASDLNAPYSLPKAGVAAIIGGDATMAEATLARLAGLGARGRAIEADMAAIRAGVAALKGDAGTAVSGFRAAREAFRDLGLVWDVALLGLSAGTRLGTVDVEVRGWVQEAAGTFGKLRTGALLAVAEHLLEGSPTPVDVPSSAVRAPTPG